MPGSVMRCRGRVGSGSSLRRSWFMYWRKVMGLGEVARPPHRSTPSQAVGCRTYADAVYPATWSLVTPFTQRGQHARRVRLCLNPAGAVDICEHLGFHGASIGPGRGTLPRLWLPVAR